MTIQRIGNVLIVVDDLEAAKAFFAELGMQLEGEATNEGPWVDQVVGLNEIAMMRTPDGHRGVGTRRDNPQRDSGAAPCRCAGMARSVSGQEFPTSGRSHAHPLYVRARRCRRSDRRGRRRDAGPRTRARTEGAPDR